MGERNRTIPLMIIDVRCVILRSLAVRQCLRFGSFCILDSTGEPNCGHASEGHYQLTNRQTKESFSL